jgi:hypothetical protein
LRLILPDAGLEDAVDHAFIGEAASSDSLFPETDPHASNDQRRV